MKRASLLFAAIFITPHVVADQGWMNIGKTADSVWEVKEGSLQFVNDRDGLPAAAVIGRVSFVGTDKLYFYQWSISSESCARKAGKLVALSMSGELISELDYVENGGSIASSIGETICQSALKYAPGTEQ